MPSFWTIGNGERISILIRTMLSSTRRGGQNNRGRVSARSWAWELRDGEIERESSVRIINHRNSFWRFSLIHLVVIYLSASSSSSEQLLSSSLFPELPLSAILVPILILLRENFHRQYVICQLESGIYYIHLLLRIHQERHSEVLDKSLPDKLNQNSISVVRGKEWNDWRDKGRRVAKEGGGGEK